MDVGGQFPAPVALLTMKALLLVPNEYHRIWGGVGPGPMDALEKRKVNGVCRGSNLQEVVHLLLYFKVQQNKITVTNKQTE
jgi:hypothetical protein